MRLIIYYQELVLCQDLDWTWGHRGPRSGSYSWGLNQRSHTRPHWAHEGLTRTSPEPLRPLGLRCLFSFHSCCPSGAAQQPPLTVCSSRHSCFTSSEAQSMLFPLPGSPFLNSLPNAYWFLRNQLKSHLLRETSLTFNLMLPPCPAHLFS